MKKLTLLSCSLLSAMAFTVNAQTINTFAGNGTGAYSGNGSPATSAGVGAPADVKIDAAGNVYMSDAFNSVIRKVNTSGIISTVAGNGTSSFSGDGSAATAATLNSPFGIAIDASGNIYIADQGNNRIRKVNTSGIISTIAGNGTNGYSGDGGAATAAKLANPEGVAVDASGNVYIADDGNNRIRKVNTSGTISTVAGTGTSGFSGNGGQATAAELDGPGGITVDASGNLYIGDVNNNCVRKVNSSGVISAFAGTNVFGYAGDGAAATAAGMDQPLGVGLDSKGNVYIADQLNNVIRMVNTSGIITTVAGNGVGAGSGSGTYSGDGGPALSAGFNLPVGVCVSSTGNVFIADILNNRVRSYKSVTGINEVTDDNQVKVFPNPNNGSFTVTLHNITGATQLEVYNMIGEKVSEKKLSQANTKVDLGNQASGVYLYQLVSENGSVLTTGKLIIQ